MSEYLIDEDRSDLGPWNSRLLEKAVERIVRRHRAEGWDRAVQAVRDLHPRCTDQCDLCIARDEILDDLSANPYRKEQP